MMARKYHRILAFILSVLLGLFSSFFLPAWSHNSAQTSKALELIQQGQQHYNLGKFDRAAQLWQEAADAYEQAGQNEGMLKSLINKAQALQDLGLVSKACKTLLKAFAVDDSACSPDQADQLLKILSPQQDSLSLNQAIGLRSLGNVLRRQGILAQSQEILQLSLSVAESSPEASATWLSLGNTERALGNQIRARWDYEEITAIIDRQSQESALGIYEPAFHSYRQATTVAFSPPLPQIQAQLNHLQLLLDLQKWWADQTNRRIASWSRLGESQLITRAEDFLSELQWNLSEKIQALLTQIESNFSHLSPSYGATYARINFAHSLLELQQYHKAELLLSTALQEARTFNDKRSESYALGYLAQVSLENGSLSQAVELTQLALMLAQEQDINGDAREITYLWQSQLGSFLRQQGDPQGAIAAYNAAYNTIQSLRNDLNTNNQDLQFDFLEEVKPVYLELADLLLSASVTERELNSLVVFNPSFSPEKSGLKRADNRLELARRVIESLQLAELDNFFQDPCSEEADIPVQIDDIDEQAAVIYPIILPNRLEVIFSWAGKNLRQATIPITEQEVNDTLDQLYDYLDNVTANSSARNILSTFNPNPEELKQNLEALLPIFREIYNWLIEPFKTELETNSIRNLVFVLNGKLQKVPMAALYDGQQYLIEQYGISLVSSLQLIDTRKSKGKSPRILAAGVSQQLQVQGKIFPELTNVPQELEQIRDAFPNSQKLLDQEFTEVRFQNQLQSNFEIIHLATHGLFSSNPEKNFILTGDGNRISINDLSTLLRSTRTGGPELLVLSACETATGDERAVLGLAGMAVRSGARSTLATLWPVSDASTAELMGQFYQVLKETKGQKLESLRIAQLSLIESLRRDPPFPQLQHLPPHPYYWAPYVLVGNWR